MPEEPPTCPTCQNEIPPGFPEGLCPQCLLADSVGDGEGIPSPSELEDAETIATQEPAPKDASRHAPSLEELRKLFPDIEILDQFGAGGMGTVYKARQPRIDRLVALKVLTCPPELHDDFAIRFEREAQVLAKLNHPNIVTLYDFGEVERPQDAGGNLFYFLMEFVDGADLNQMIRTGELKSEQSLKIVPAICDALQYAHDEGITHRDVKPANILVDTKGNVKIADFGLAKLIGDSETMMTGLTMTGTTMGTPHYMAPEQWETPEKVDHRADIYALGVVFYEMLTGERPAGIFDPPSKKADVDVRIDTVVLRAMEKELDKRYQRADEVKDDVTLVSTTTPKGKPIKPKPRKATAKSSLSESKSRGVLVSVLAIILLGGIGFWFSPLNPFTKDNTNGPSAEEPHAEGPFLDRDPLLYLPMDSPAEGHLASQVTLYGDSKTTPSPVGRGLAFDGNDDYIDLGQIQLPDTWTLAFWGRMDDVQKKRKFFKFADGLKKYQVEAQISNTNKLRVWANEGFSFEMNPEIDEWNHYVLRVESGGTELFVNGTKIEGNNASAPTLLRRFCYLGAGADDSGQPEEDEFLLGAMDEFLLVDRALTHSEIQRLAITQDISSTGIGSEPEFRGGLDSEKPPVIPITAHPRTAPGRLRAAGTAPNGYPPNLSKVDGLEDLVDVGGRIGEWVALRANGETISSNEQADFTGIRRIGWSFAHNFALIDTEGKIRFPENRAQELPAAFEDAVVVDVQLGNEHGIALTEDGRALVFGKRYQEQVGDPTDGAWYGTPRWPMPPAEILENVKDIAVTTTHAAVLQKDGTLSVFGWEGVRDLPQAKGLARIEAIGSAPDAIYLLDANGQVWKHALPRNPAPDQPVLGAKWIVKIEMSEPAVTLKGECWQGKSGEWHTEFEAVDAILKRDEVRTPGGISIHHGIFSGQNYQSVLWIEPAEPTGNETPAPAFTGTLRAFGKFPQSGEEIDLTKAEGISDFTQVVFTAESWVGLRENGTLVSSDGRGEDAENVRRLLPGFHHSFGYIDADGRLTLEGTTFTKQGESGVMEIPEEVQEIGVVDAAWGDGDAIALLRDGTARVWGDHYEGEFNNQPQWPRPDASVLRDVIQIAKTASRAAVLQSDGTLHVWGRFGDQTAELRKKWENLVVADIESGWSSFLVRLDTGRVTTLGGGQTLTGGVQARESDAIFQGLVRVGERWKVSSEIEEIPPAVADTLSRLEGLRPGQFAVHSARSAEDFSAIWIEPEEAVDSAPTTGSAPVYPTDEAGFREWLEGKVLLVTEEKLPWHPQGQIFWITAERLHWMGIESAETKSWNFEVTEPGMISWAWTGYDDFHRLRFGADGRSFLKLMPNDHDLYENVAGGQVRTDLSAPGRLRIEGHFAGGVPVHLSKAEDHDDFVDFYAGINHWVALRANGEVVTSSTYMDHPEVRGKSFRRIVPGPGSDFALITVDGKLVVPDNKGLAESDLPDEIRSGGIVDAAVGYDHGVAILKDGQAVAWGPRYEEKVGDLDDPRGYGTPQWPAPPAEALRDVVAASASYTHAATLHSDGSLSMWNWTGTVDPGLPDDLGKITRLSVDGDQFYLQTATKEIWMVNVPRNTSPGSVSGTSTKSKKVGDGTLGRRGLWCTPENRWVAGWGWVDGGTKGKLLAPYAFPPTTQVYCGTQRHQDPDGQKMVIWIENK